jgi:deazaflavin-dependent oxidoreductase (nitroreductase family)
MSNREDIFDSTTERGAAHIDRYVKSNGADGHRYLGCETLLLTTRGRRSGKLRRMALIYGTDGDRFVIVASNGGADAHPAWYLNLLAEPRVTVQILGEIFAAHAHPASPEERERLWQLMTSIFPKYDEYAEDAPREIPVVVLDPTLNS